MCVTMEMLGDGLPRILRQHCAYLRSTPWGRVHREGEEHSV
jgi:hypothetical protein